MSGTPQPSVRCGDRLERLFKLRKFTRVYVAKVLGVTDRTVRRWCKGDSEPPPYHLRQLEELLDVKYGTLYRPGKVRVEVTLPPLPPPTIRGKK